MGALLSHHLCMCFVAARFVHRRKLRRRFFNLLACLIQAAESEVKFPSNVKSAVENGVDFASNHQFVSEPTGNRFDNWFMCHSLIISYKLKYHFQMLIKSLIFVSDLCVMVL